MAAGTWTEVMLDSPPGGFVATDAVSIYFDVGQSKEPVSVRQLTMKTCIRIGRPHSPRIIVVGVIV